LVDFALLFFSRFVVLSFSFGNISIKFITTNQASLKQGRLTILSKKAECLILAESLIRLKLVLQSKFPCNFDKANSI